MSNKNLWPDYKSKIAGVWKCISYEMYDKDPETGKSNNLIAKPHGDEPLGFASISPSGWLAAHIARRDRMGPLPSGNPWQTGQDKEVAHVARGISMYCGYLELFEDEEGMYWQTKVECASDPSRLGGLEVRRVELQEGGKYMVLRPKQDLVMEDGTRARAQLKWEKFE